ncbi:MAG TPA: extracellular solute-binding protein, partial [Rhodothermales bacterium]
ATFVSGRAAMIFDGPWDLPRLHEAAPFDWAIAPLPAGPAGPATYLAGEQLAIFRQSKHPDEAWTFIRWVLQPDVQAYFSAESGYLPVRRSTLEIPSYRAHLEQDWALKAFIDQMPIARTRRSIDDFHVEINRYVAEAIERTLVAGEDPAATLRQAAVRSNALLQN